MAADLGLTQRRTTAVEGFAGTSTEAVGTHWEVEPGDIAETPQCVAKPLVRSRLIPRYICTVTSPLQPSKQRDFAFRAFDRHW